MTQLPTAAYSDVTVTDGTRLRVATFAGERRGVLAVHGLSASHANWLPTVAALGGEVEVVAPDLRGRGDSDKPATGYGMAQHADDIADVARAAGLERVVLLGHSMGAYIAEQVAVRHPSLVASLVIVDGGYVDLPPGITMDMLVATALPFITARLATVWPSEEAVLGEFRQHQAFVDDWDHFAEAYYRYDVEPVEGGLRGKASEAAVRADYVDMGAAYLQDTLAQITCPVHLLRAPAGKVYAGVDAPLLPDEMVAAFRAKLPQLTDEVVEGTNHYTIGLSARGGEAVADAVRRALKEL